MPIVWGGLIVAGIVAGGWAAKEGGDAAESTAKALKWASVAGGVYVGYRALKTVGAIK